MARTSSCRTCACLAAAACTLIAALLAGCSPELPAQPTTKMVQVPTGGEPVLTPVERKQLAAAQEPASVARASYEQPLNLPPPSPLKPFEEWTEPEAAADALGRIGAAAVPALIGILQNPDPEVRLKGIEVLARMGGDAKDAVPDLIRLLEDPDERVRKAAARTLGRIGPAAKDAVPALMRSLLEPEP